MISVGNAGRRQRALLRAPAPAASPLQMGPRPSTQHRKSAALAPTTARSCGLKHRKLQNGSHDACGIVILNFNSILGLGINLAPVFIKLLELFWIASERAMVRAFDPCRDAIERTIQPNRDS